MYQEQAFVVPRDEFPFAQPELGQPGECVAICHHQVWRRAGEKFHKFGMPRANGPRLSEKQYVRTTIDASQFPFDRRERIEGGKGEFEAGKFLQTCRERCERWPLQQHENVPRVHDLRQTLQPLPRSGQIFDPIVAWNLRSDAPDRLQCRKRRLIRAAGLEKQERFLALDKLQTLSFSAFRRAPAALERSCDYSGGLLCTGNFLQAGCIMSADHKIVPHAGMKFEKSFVILRSFLVIEIV